MLETEDFQRNNISTTWLDAMIAQRFKSEKPDSLLAVICGSLHVADQTILNAFQLFQASLERGQVLPAYTLTNCVDVELIYEGIKYKGNRFVVQSVEELIVASQSTNIHLEKMKCNCWLQLQFKRRNADRIATRSA